MMITRFASLSGRLLVAVAFLFAFTACGGGGGGGGGTGFLPDTDNNNTYYLMMELVDSSGNQTNSVTSASPSTLKVRVTKNGKNGAPVADVVVSVETTAGIINPASGTALTDSTGIAVFRVEADATKGAGTLTASAVDPAGETITTTLTFQVGSTGLRLGYLDENGLFIENEIGIEPQSLLASQAVAQLSLVIVDENGDLSSSAETVSITSGCIASGQAVLDPASPIVSGDGTVSTSYRPAGCTGNDALTASLEGSTAQAFGTIGVASPAANGFTFVSAEPTTIVLRGTGGGGGDRSETSTVTFRVVDSNNSPLGGIKVNFALTTYVGGLKLSPASAVSTSDGLVKVNVTSGDIPTPVRVIATTAAGDGSGQDVSTVSDILTVSTGLPDQNSISLSVSNSFVIENGFITDGISRIITVRMADKFNNPVPDGTAAVFTTEYGAIDPSCQTGLKDGDRITSPQLEPGECSVLWTSQAPRFPTLTGNTYIRDIFSPGYNCPGFNLSSGPCPADLGYTRGGRSTVMVTAVGEESFIDRNGNGIMDENEKDLFANLTEAFLDNNEDGIFNPAAGACQGAGADSPQCIAGQEEIFVDFNNNGKFDKNNNPAVYNGLLCPIEGDGVWCSRDLVNVRDYAVLILSDPQNWYITLLRGNNPSNGASWNGGEYTVVVSDRYNNSPPAGSTVEVSGLGDCSFSASSTVPNTTAYGAFRSTPFEVMGEGTTGSLEVTLSPSGGGAPYTRTFNCVPQPPPDPNSPGGGVGP